MRDSCSTMIFDEDNIWKILLRIAPPVMLAQLIQAMYNIVDSYFVGRYSGDGLTALSVIFPVQLIVTALAVGTGGGLITLVAREDRVKLADQLLAVLGETPANEQDQEQFIELDARFHYELLQLQGNRLWMTIADAIFPVYRKGIKDTLLHASREEEQKFYELHRGICAGIRDGSYEQCEEAIEEHYRLL